MRDEGQAPMPPDSNLGLGQSQSVESSHMAKMTEDKPTTIREQLTKNVHHHQIEARQASAAIELLADPAVEKVVEALRNPLIRRYFW